MLIDVHVGFCYTLPEFDKEKVKTPKVISDLKEVDSLLKDNLTESYLDYLEEQLKNNQDLYIVIRLNDNEILSKSVVTYCINKIAVDIAARNAKLPKMQNLASLAKYAFFRFFKSPEKESNELYFQECNWNGELYYPYLYKNDATRLISALSTIQSMYKCGKPIDLDLYRFLYHDAVKEFMES